MAARKLEPKFGGSVLASTSAADIGPLLTVRHANPPSFGVRRFQVRLVERRLHGRQQVGGDRIAIEQVRIGARHLVAKQVSHACHNDDQQQAGGQSAPASSSGTGPPVEQKLY